MSFFEDDTTLLADLPKLIKEVDLHTIDFLKLSGQHKRLEKEQRALSEPYKLMKLAHGPLDAGAYLITKKGADRLEKYCSTMHMAIDVLMDRSYSHGVPIYSIQPYPAQTLQNENEGHPLCSNIGPRPNKYDPDKPFGERMITRILRLISSCQKECQKSDCL